MKITSVETFHCDAGWRVWTFIKMMTDQGIVGWSECTDSHGSPRAIGGVIKDLEHLVIGKDPFNHEKIYGDLLSATRQSTGSVIQKAIAGVENALIDIKGKALGIPAYQLLGGKIRDTVRVYWSHCGTSRVRAAHHINKPVVKSLEDITAFAKEVKERGFTALKTNPAFFGENPFIYMPGFGKSMGGPEMNADYDLIKGIEQYMAAWRNGLGEDFELILDLNFNFKTEGYIKIAKMLEQFNLTWLELDSYDAQALRYIREKVAMPICSGENLYGLREYRPYFEKQSMDVASVDVSWNGAWQAKKIADMADIYEMNIAPHNHHSHFGTFMSAHFAAAIPNLRILEVDIDDVAWKDELTAMPKIEHGYVTISDGPGWGVEVNEKILQAHQVSF